MMHRILVLKDYLYSWLSSKYTLLSSHLEDAVISYKKKKNANTNVKYDYPQHNMNKYFQCKVTITLRE